MRIVALGSFAAALLFVVPGAWASPQEGRYTAWNPWDTTQPDCFNNAPRAPSLGLGGSCFAPVAGANHFTATIQDDHTGPGFGWVVFCYDQPGGYVCDDHFICNGVGEGSVVPGFSTVFVDVGGLQDGPAFWEAACGVSSFSWVPTQGTISLDLTAI
jgi:hypothetical protein